MSDVHECLADGCPFDTRGTAGGAQPPLCGAYGGPPKCLADFMAADPEDWDWSEYDEQ